MEASNRMNQTYRFSLPGTEGRTPVVYFIGIGGIGMSAIARFFHSIGVQVSGYDKTATPLTRELEAAGIAVHYEDQPDGCPRNADLVVYTPAVPADMGELVFYRENGYKVVKRSDVLQLITESAFNICIAGTHGKTTITTMVAHLLRHTGFGCNAFLGGIAVNYGTNFWSDTRNCCVVEADEYDRSFLKLSPDVAVVTAMDADHLDIYGTAENMEQAFIDFSHRLRPGGKLVAKFGLQRGRELQQDNRVTYSLQNDAADVYATNIRMANGGYTYDAVLPEETITGIRLNMGGMHNVENSLAALAAISSLNIEPGLLRNALEAFRGVKRRFEYIMPPVEKEQAEEWIAPVFIDDYAHHPEELRALITGAQSLFRGRRCTVVFQPHLFTRTRDLADGFAEVLDLADQVVLLPIYPARELPIPGVTSEMIKDKMQRADCRVIEKDALLQWIRDAYIPAVNKEFGEVLITAGAGDIDTLVEPIGNELKKYF